MTKVTHDDVFTEYRKKYAEFHESPVFLNFYEDTKDLSPEEYAEKKRELWEEYKKRKLDHNKFVVE